MTEDKTFAGSDGAFHWIDWYGEGPSAHFAHATGLNAGTYTPLVERLAGSLHMMGMDDRGHGKTTAPADYRKLTSWDIFRDDLERFLRNLDRPVIAMGHSRGAVVSLLTANVAPDLVSALILVDPTIIPLTWCVYLYLMQKLGVASRFIPIAAGAAKRRMEWQDGLTILKTYRSKAPFHTWTDGFLESYLTDGTEELSDGSVRLTCSPQWESKTFASCPADIWRHVRLVKQPTLVVYGSESDVFPSQSAKRFRESVPHAKMVRLENTSHFVPMEQPDRTAEEIKLFLAEIELL